MVEKWFDVWQMSKQSRREWREFVIGINPSEKEVELESCSIVGSLEDVEIMNTKVNLVYKLGKKIDSSKLKISEKLTIEQRNKLVKLILKHEKAFKWTEDDIGLTDLTKHEIKTGDTKPIKQRAYRLPQAAQEEVSKQIKNMLGKNVIRESKSPWASPII
ncbi:unnamed protein product [Brachionus calyciflorus]|uniref:Peptidase A9 domain-containing protein n=1 Tax=Brachionus calyciflorus TaxID=104777 RepID=A0A813YAB9_9BILA|nr:unnamed protein product [Brachionus calyciflorus]